MKPFLVYLLRCADGSFYVGHTDDLERRVAQHRSGEFEGYTRERLPVELAWAQETATREEALASELQIKGWSREEKKALIAGDWERVKMLAQSGGLRQAPPERIGGARVGFDPRFDPDSNPASNPAPNPARPEPVEALLFDAQNIRLLTALQGNRRALAKSITLLESTRADHRARADELLNAVLPRTGNAMRLGISGVPGVGKSTFIEALGLALIAKGHCVAVLAIDPSSSISGGSILGDKTRMERLSVNEAAYIRPSPASGTLGGVAEKTREAMLVCEAAGYDVVIVETVGVGQSETAVASMTDMFVLMQLPNAGDDLQAIKKGVMELADLVVINKADIDPDAAMRAEAHISGSLRMFGAHAAPEQWVTRVIQLSALKGQGVDTFWSAVEEFHAKRRASGEFDARRKTQSLAWMWDIVHARLHADFRHHTAVRNALPATVRDVTEARVAPSSAARHLLNLFEQAPR